MIHPNGMITLRKLEEMIDDPKHWKVVAKSKIIDNEVVLTDRCLLREYVFCVDYELAYDFIGDDWDEYFKEKTNINGKLTFSTKIDDIEIRVRWSDSTKKYYAEIVKWEDDKVDSEDKLSCFTLAYWIYHEGWDLKFVGNRFFEYVSDSNLTKVYEVIKIVQTMLDNGCFVEEQDD